MMDQIRKLGDTIDIDKLSKDLGCRVVPVSALNAEGIKELVKAVGDWAELTEGLDDDQLLAALQAKIPALTKPENAPQIKH